MKEYVGEPGGAGYGDRVIIVHDKDSRTLLRHHVKHSPDGFSWGYSGSGPSELARCMLWDVLGREPEPILYHRFKYHFISQLNRTQEFTIHESAIWDWLKLQGVTK
jgi:hypothetical protein